MKEYVWLRKEACEFFIIPDYGNPLEVKFIYRHDGNYRFKDIWPVSDFIFLGEL